MAWGSRLSQVRRLQVRNSAGGIVQLAYGEDNLDPVAMEAGGGKPIDLPRSLSVIEASLPQQPRIPENASDEGRSVSLRKLNPHFVESTCVSVVKSLDGHQRYFIVQAFSLGG